MTSEPSALLEWYLSDDTVSLSVVITEYLHGCLRQSSHMHRRDFTFFIILLQSFVNVYMCNC